MWVYQKNLPVSVSVSGPGQGKSTIPEPVDVSVTAIGFWFFGFLLSILGMVSGRILLPRNRFGDPTPEKKDVTKGS